MSIEEAVIDHISQALKVDPAKLTVETGIGEIPEWDSLAHSRLILSLEKAFDILIDIEDAIDIETIEDIIDVIQEKKGLKLEAV